MPSASDSNAHLGPMLEAVARLIRAGIEPDESTVRALLLAAGRDPSPGVVRELLHWSDLLRTLRWQPSAGLRDAAFEMLTTRGLPPALVDAVLDGLTATPSSPAAAARRREVARTPGSALDEVLLGISRVRWAAGLAPVAFRSGLPLVLLLGLILRVWLTTTQSAWLDEAWSLHYMARVPLDALYNEVKYNDTKSPLYYALLHIWLWFTGFGVVQARLLSVAFGMATIPAVYFLTGLLFDKATALCAAFLAAISPIATWYSDEIRMYAPTSLFAVLTVYLLLRAVQGRRARWWVGYAVCAAFAITFDPSGVYLPLAVNLFYVLLLARRRVRAWPWLASNCLAVVLATPAVLLLRFQMADHVGEINWIPAPTVSIVWSSALDMLSLNGDGFWTGLAFAAVLIVGAFAFLRDRRDRCLLRVYLLLTLLIVTPFGVALALSSLHPIFLTRTVQTAAYGLLILCARGIVLLLRTRFPAGMLAVVAIAGLNATSLYAAATTPINANWPALAQAASRQVSLDSLIVIDPFYLSSPFDLYWEPYHRRVAQHDYPPISSEDVAAQVFRGYNSVWLVAYYIYNGDNPPIDAGTLYLRTHFQLASTTLFYGLSLYHFVAPSSAKEAPAAALPDHVHAVPDRVQDGSTTLIQVDTSPGAVCTLRVVYDTDHGATGWFGAAQPADFDGVAAWRVQVVTRANAGTATAPCMLAGRAALGKARLFIAH
jgi:hypothetical protein